MRVCFISFEYPPNIMGGAGTYAETLVHGLRDRGVDVFVVSHGDRHDENQKTFRVPTSNSVYWRRLFFMESAITLFRKLNEHYKFDLVHFNEPHIITERLKVPTLSTVHSSQINEIKLKLASPRMLRTVADVRDLVLKSSIGSLFDALTAHAVDKIICPSNSLAAMVRSYCFADESRIVVVPNGVDLRAFGSEEFADSEQFLRQYSLEKNSYVLFVGRLTVFKGVQYAIEAFRGLIKDYPNVKLAIVGTGGFGNHLKYLAREMTNVVFLGRVNSVRMRKLLYNNSLLAIVPSLYEALPTAALEAMACGKAIVASDVGGIPMAVRHGKNGFLVKPSDARELEIFIRKLCADPNLSSEMGLFGRKLVEEQFTVDRMVDETLKVYDSLL